MPLYCRWFVYRSILKYFLMRTSFSVVLWSGLTCTSFRGWPNIATISPLTIFYSFQNLIIPGKMAHTAFNNCVGQMIECCLPNLSACLLYIDSENKALKQTISCQTSSARFKTWRRASLCMTTSDWSTFKFCYFIGRP